MPSGPIYDLDDAQSLVYDDQFWIDEEDRLEMAKLGYQRSDLRKLFLRLDSSHFHQHHDYGEGMKQDAYTIGNISPDGVMHLVYIKFWIKDNEQFLMIPSFHRSKFGAEYELF